MEICLVIKYSIAVVQLGYLKETINSIQLPAISSLHCSKTNSDIKTNYCKYKTFLEDVVNKQKS